MGIQEGTEVQLFTPPFSLEFSILSTHSKFYPRHFAETVLIKSKGFPRGAVVENLPANAGDTGSSPGLGRSHMLWSN